MKNYIRSIKMKGAIREIISRIENIINDNPFIIDATPIGDLSEPTKRSSLKIPEGETIIILAQHIVDMVKEFYEEK